MNKIEAYKNIKKILNSKRGRTNSIVSVWTSLLFLAGRYESGLEFLEKREKNLPKLDYF